MVVSFGLRIKRQKLEGNAVTVSFAEAQLASEADISTLTEEETLSESFLQQEEGSSFAIDSNFSEALRSWNRAIALTPDRAVLHELKAQALLELDHVWDAVQCAVRATALAPEWPDGHLTRGRAHLELGEPELALVSMEEVLRLEPTHVEAAAEIANVRVLVQQRIRHNPGGRAAISSGWLASTLPADMAASQ